MLELKYQQKIWEKRHFHPISSLTNPESRFWPSIGPSGGGITTYLEC